MSKKIKNTLITWLERGDINQIQADNLYGFYEEDLCMQREKVFERVNIWLGTLFIEEFMNKKLQKMFEKERKKWRYSEK